MCDVWVKARRIHLRNSDYQKPQYVDLSYGWQNRGALEKRRARNRRWWRVVLWGMIGLPALAYVLWRWM